MQLKKLLNIYPTNKSKIDAIRKYDFDQEEIMEVITVFLADKEVSLPDVSGKSLSDVVNSLIIQNEKLTLSKRNELFPILLKNSKFTFTSLMHLSDKRKLNANQEFLFFEKVIQEHMAERVYFNHMNKQNVARTIDKCIEKASVQKNIDDIVSILLRSENIFFMNNHKKEFEKKVTESSVFNDHLKKMNTKYLLSKYKKITLDYYNCKNDFTVFENVFRQKISEELATRGHVIKKSQNDLIKKMSIHTGKKLTLQEAQLLNNQLQKRKTKNNEK